MMELKTHYSEHRFRNHVLVYVYSGTLEICGEQTSVYLRKGECAFICRNEQVGMMACSENKASIHIIYLELPRNFLCEFYHTLPEQSTDSPKEVYIRLNKLPDRPEITSLFGSLIPYFKLSKKMSKELHRLKMAEAAYALLNIDRCYFDTLFDFIGCHKISILDILLEPNPTSAWMSSQ